LQLGGARNSLAIGGGDNHGAVGVNRRVGFSGARGHAGGGEAALFDENQLAVAGDLQAINLLFVLDQHFPGAVQQID
jgi:hypothetical protein